MAASMAARCLGALCLGTLCLGALAPSAALAASPSWPGNMPPSQPQAPSASNTTTTMTTLAWGASTDSVAVTGYELQELENGSWTTIDTVVPNSAGQQILTQELFGLTPATSYQFALIAVDAAGNHSARSNPTTVTTMATTAFPSCQIFLATYNPGFTFYAEITNTTAAALTGWSLSFTMPSSTIVDTAFGGTVTHTATGGTETAASYNATIGQGTETFVGFTGSVSPYNPPSNATFDGQPCTSS